MIKLFLICLFLLCSLTACADTEPLESESSPLPSQAQVVTPAPTPTALPTPSPTPSPTYAPLLGLAPTATPTPTKAPVRENHEFVKITDYIPNIEVDLVYATDRNFTGVAIYEFTDAYLRYGTVMKLVKVQEELEEMGYSLKIWDGFRPVAAQYKLWEVYPDPVYVANPNGGASIHNSGSAVDLTIVDENGIELEMPTGFDDFSVKADRNYSDCTKEQAANSQFLEDIMEKHGFNGYFGEWWHYEDNDWYATEYDFMPPIS